MVARGRVTLSLGMPSAAANEAVINKATGMDKPKVVILRIMFNFLCVTRD